MFITYKIKKDDLNYSLKYILKNKLYISNILRYELVKYNKILINNKTCRLNTNLNLNDEIKIILDSQTDLKNDTANFSDKFLPYKFSLDILYEDDYLLIINKPENMEIHPCSSNYETTLANAIFYYLKEKNELLNIHIITRLDKNTTGACIFAKHKYIQELFIRKKDVINLKKEYIAVVNGIVNEKHGIIEKNIMRDENSIITRKVCEAQNGDYAKTEYYVNKINYDKNYSVLNVILHTGRTHQIRVHFNSIGHSLLGDSLYSKDKNITSLINRQALHSYKITFNHPITNKNIDIIAPIPNDIKELI